MPDIIARGMAANAQATADAAASQAALANERIGQLPNGIKYIGAVDYATDLPATANIGDCYTVKYTASGTPDGREYVYGDVGGTNEWYPLTTDFPIVKGTGTGSAIIGDLENSIASGDYSVAEGAKNASIGAGTHSEGISDHLYTDYVAADASDEDIIAARSAGGQNFAVAKGEGAHAEGANSLALGNHSHAEGNGTQATNNSAHAEGTGSIASGKYSHAEGLESQATASRAHAEGYMTNATADGAHSEGRETTASGKFSHAEGRGSNSFAEESHAEGYGTSANGKYSHAEGNVSSAGADSSHAEGDSTYTAGVASHSEGVSSSASGRGSHAEGYSTEAIGDFSHAEGDICVAYGANSHAGGYASRAEAENSFAHGEAANAQGAFSAAFGKNTTATAEGTFVSGSYNVEYIQPSAEIPEGGYLPNENWDYSSSELHIADAPDLLQFVKLVNDGTSDFSGQTIYLDADIDLNPGWLATVTLSGETGAGLPTGSGTLSLPSAPPTQWTNTMKSKSSSADQPYLFKGTFDGQGHAIYGIYYNRTSSVGPVCKNCGLLFNRVSGASISNLAIRNSIFMWSENVGNSEIGMGGVIGGFSDNSTMQNVYSEVTVILRSSGHSKATIGGLVGWQGSGSISLCVYNGKMIETESSSSWTYPATSSTRQIGGLAGETEGGVMSSCVGIAEFAVKEPLVNLGSGDQSTTVGGANQAVAGHYGSDYGTLLEISVGPAYSKYFAGQWSFSDYVGSYVPSYMLTNFLSDFVLTPAIQHGDGDSYNRHDAFSVVRKELRYAPSTSEYLLQVGDIQITKGQLTSLLDFLKPPTTITIQANDWDDIPDPDAMPFYQHRRRCPKFRF